MAFNGVSPGKRLPIAGNKKKKGSNITSSDAFEDVRAGTVESNVAETNLFHSLDISKVLVKWLNKRGITRMTKVQSLAITPFLKCRNDLLVQSCTGSGKTLCFVLPILELCLQDINKCLLPDVLDVFALILLPTRELAIQLNEIIIDALEYLENIISGPSKTNRAFKIGLCYLHCALLIGGTEIENDIKVLNNTKEGKHVKSFVIATPGRLRHLMDVLQQSPVWTFKNLVVLILDEADRLLEMGYQNDITTILGFLPKRRKNGLYSATLSTEIVSFAKGILSDPIFINADFTNDNQKSLYGTKDNYENCFCGKETGSKYTIPTELNNYYVLLDLREKLYFVLLFLQHMKVCGASKCVIFFLTCDMVDYYASVLEKCAPILNNSSTTENLGVNVAFYKLHRKMPTKKRQNNLNSFRCISNNVIDSPDKLQVLLCTDVFSRGIDVPEIDWVIQFDAPQDPDFYIHRIGRASRAGASGNALLLLTPEEDAYVQFQLNRKIRLTPLPADIFDSCRIYCENPDALGDISFPHTKEFDDTEVLNGKMRFSEFLESTKPEVQRLPWDKTSRFISYLRTLLSKDRLLLLSASRAFVSYTRAYSEHRLKSIFEEKKLDYGSLATSFGVLRVPRVKEILGKKLNNFAPSDVDPVTVPFTDQRMEEERIERLKLPPKDFEAKRPVKESKVISERKHKRTKGEKRMAKRQNEWKEQNEFAREEALVKKLKTGKICFSKFKKLVRGDESKWEEDLDDFVNDSKKVSQTTEQESDQSYRRWLFGKRKRRRNKPKVSH